MKKEKSNFASRMKEYEHCYRFYLPKRTPVIIRLDGKAFHSFTKHMEKPFDRIYTFNMLKSIANIFSEIQGLKLAYFQSDEVSLLLNNYEKIESSSFFNNNLQKICSVSASLLTAEFNHNYSYHLGKKATFDSRVFVLPKHEVCNYFLWRQKDSERNSLNSLAQKYFTENELFEKSISEVHDMLFSKSINWNDCITEQKRGSCVYRDKDDGEIVIDRFIPIFSQDRNYIEQHVFVDEVK